MCFAEEDIDCLRTSGDHVHLGPGITAERMREPAFDYLNCPAVDFVRGCS